MGRCQAVKKSPSYELQKKLLDSIQSRPEIVTRNILIPVIRREIDFLLHTIDIDNLTEQDAEYLANILEMCQSYLKADTSQ